MDDCVRVCVRATRHEIQAFRPIVRTAYRVRQKSSTFKHYISHNFWNRKKVNYDNKAYLLDN